MYNNETYSASTLASLADQQRFDKKVCIQEGRGDGKVSLVTLTDSMFHRVIETVSSYALSVPLDSDQTVPSGRMKN